MWWCLHSCKLINGSKQRADTLISTPMISPDYKYVVAIDVGTTSSAYAYAKKEDIDFDKNQVNVTCNQAWGVGKHNYMKIKTPTSVLLDENGELDSFGYKAEYNYDKRVKDGVNDFYFFRNFRMALYKNNPTSQMVIFDVNGRRMMVQTVFSKTISAFMKEFKESITNSGNNISSEEVRWVLTVPAIWSEAAKQFMKICAYLAGIPDNQLIIALESEAASIYCQYVQKRDIDDNAISVSKKGTQYMVVDLGGGKVDIAVNETLGNGFLREIHRPTGEDCGGNLINQSLVQELSQIVGNSFLKDVKRSYPKECFDIQRDFEAAMKCVDPFEENKISLRLPYVFLNIIRQEINQEQMKQILHLGPHCEKIIIENDWVYISSNLIRERLLQPIAEKIYKLIMNILFKIKNPRLTKILLVGGFADSKCIQEAVRKGFPSNKIIVPHEADLCIIKGAVILGHSPDLIQHDDKHDERVIREYYNSAAQTVVKNATSKKTS
ncbi:Hypothetical predicted protein [Mytilus galloprovincialis]|uniref:Uncharacterized protein n=2 Tax=Mytilus galloprovincialis TaxID=29158 RepID=A0A8B6HED8_MYTGA|nr:Hypothetical predicted protein [Mytilus galloprovincialis]